jgi:Ni2+-binding GTPase involved in maturation of urease and hydrogenase
MKLVTIAGLSGAGKTQVALKAAAVLQGEGLAVGAVKFDCITTRDHERYRQQHIPALTGISGSLCPDHYFVTNIEACVNWGLDRGLDVLVSESAGLCCRCSPHIKGFLAVCVIDCLSGAWTPKKAGPLLLFADIVVISKADIVSQAEREVFVYRVRQVNRKAAILFVNGLTGQGAGELAKRMKDAPDVKAGTGIAHEKMRFPLPLALCSYCMGETRIGDDYVTTSSIIRRIAIPDDENAAPDAWSVHDDARDEGDA